jgi:hypothetical protein
MPLVTRVLVIVLAAAAAILGPQAAIASEPSTTVAAQTLGDPDDTPWG